MSPAEQTCDHVPDFPRPLAEARQVDLLCDEFEQQWRQGARPSIDDFLARAPAEAAAVLRVRLPAIEQELCGGTGAANPEQESGPAAAAGLTASVALPAAP